MPASSPSPHMQYAPGAAPRDWGFHEDARPLRLLLPLGLAVFAHLALTLVRPAPPAPLNALNAIEVEMIAEPLAQPEPEPEPEPELVPEVEPPASAVAAPFTHVPPTPQPSTPVDSGPVGDADNEGPAAEELAAPIVTASEGGGAEGWDLLSGQGTSLGSGGLGRPGRGGTGLARSTTLSARDLSRSAIAPDLQPLVERNFPTAARMARVGGTVTISAIIQPDGTPTDIRVVKVDPRGRGFGETCSRTVHEGPEWLPKLNRDGRPVAAKVTYTCKFTPPQAELSEVGAPTTGTGANRVWTRPAR